MKKIPFNKPFIIGKELEYISQAVQDGHLSGDGMFTKECQKWIEDQFGTKKAVLTHSCTAALEMAAILADIQPGDEVILPSYTFVSTANAFVLRGATPVWCDIRSDTFNIDETKIESLITKKTKAIVPVHYAGVGCEMNTIMDIASRYNLLVIEDAAQAVYAKYKGQWLGTIGHFACYSFHETKNFISGEGGALLVNDEKFIERTEIVWEKGTNRSQFFKGVVDKYTWVDVGSSFLPSELVAAFLFAQLEHVEQVNEKRLSVWKRYDDFFRPLEEQGLLRCPNIPEYCQHNAHMYEILLPSSQIRDELMAKLREQEIVSVFHYIPLHSAPMGKKVQPNSPSLPVTDDVSSRLLRMPLFYNLSSSEQDCVMEKTEIILQSC